MEGRALIFPTSAFTDFCTRMKIPSKDGGRMNLTPLYGTQRYLLEQIAAGMERGIRDFVILKGRQQGITTVADALALYWPMKYPGTVGMFVADSDDNRRVRRAIIRQMLWTLPRDYRRRVGIDNQEILEFLPSKARDYSGSWLMFEQAGKREGEANNLGRSRGLNFLLGDELSSWVDDQGISSLQASLAEYFQWMLYLWFSTARGFGPFRDLYMAAEKSPSSMAVFIGWWLKETYRIDESERAIWDAYAWEPTRDEQHWSRIVKRRYGVTIDAGHLVWRRHQLHSTKFRGDENMLQQEHPNLPEDAFVSFGDKFIAPVTIRALYEALAEHNPPQAMVYEWGTTLDDTAPRPVGVDDPKAHLFLWQQPDPNGVYIIAAHPWGSSAPTATMHVVQVWRAFPDALEQVAEFASREGNSYQLAWVIAHMGGVYGTAASAPYEIICIDGSGINTMQEMDRLRNYGHGITAKLRVEVMDLLGAVNRYAYGRADSMRGRKTAWEFQASNRDRLRIQYGLRDEVERGHVSITSRALVDELAQMRRGGDGNNDQISAGARAMTAAMAIESWLEQAMPVLISTVPPKKPVVWAPEHIGEAMTMAFLQRRVLKR